MISTMITGNHRRRDVDRRAGDHDVGHRRDLVGEDLQALDQRNTFRSANAWRDAKPALSLMIACFIDVCTISRGWPQMNSQRSGWRACQASNSATVLGQSSRALLPPWPA
jgi:hypothetical protein